MKVPTSDASTDLVDVIDSDDRVVGRATRGEIRAGNLLHRVTGILVRDSAGGLFVHRRTAAKDIYPGRYDMFCGGVVGVGESYEACAARELEEELGISGVPLRPLFHHRFEDAEKRCISAVFEVDWDGEVRLQESEIDWGAWMSLADVIERLGEWSWPPDSVELFKHWLETVDSS